MSSYINCLIAVMILCQITTIITPDSERAKQSIRTICAIISLLVLLSPLKNIASLSEQISEKLSSAPDTNYAAGYTTKESDSIQLLQYITAYYNVDEVSMTVHTNEADTQILKIELHIPNYPYTACSVMENELQELLNFPVYVFGE